MNKYVITKTITLESKGNYENETQAIKAAKEACKEKIGDVLETSFFSGEPFLSLDSGEWEVKEVSRILTRSDYIENLLYKGYRVFLPEKKTAIPMYIKGNTLVVVETSKAHEITFDLENASEKEEEVRFEE